MSARHPTPWTWEEHGLSEGYSCIVYDARDQRIADHLDRETAALIAAAGDLYEALKTLVPLCQAPWPLLKAGRAALAKADGLTGDAV